MTKKLQVYDAPEITVSFDPNVCKHSGVCLRTLPGVFDVRRQRWIHADAADPSAVAAAIQMCPSGALQFYRNPSRDPRAALQLARRVLVNELALCLDGKDGREAAARGICAAIAKARGYDFVGLYDVRPDGIEVVGWTGLAPAHPRLAPRTGLCGAAAASGETLVANDVAADSRYVMTSADTRSEMIVPVVDPATRDVLGTIDVASRRPDAFDSGDREIVEDCALAIASFWTEPS